MSLSSRRIETCRGSFADNRTTDLQQHAAAQRSSTMYSVHTLYGGTSGLRTTKTAKLLHYINIFSLLKQLTVTLVERVNHSGLKKDCYLRLYALYSVIDRNITRLPTYQL